MAKTESTAVNDLIKIAATQTPLRKDPSEDLMFTIPPKKDRSSKHVMTPRGTDVPLPRDRAPHGTQEHAVAMPAITISSAPASRSLTPPPLAAKRSTTIPPMTRPSDPAIEPIATRATRPSLPPPTRASLPPPSRASMPSEYPIVSAVHSLPMAPALVPELEADLDDDDDSFDVDVAPFHGDSTAQVAKQRSNLGWMIKLAPVAAVMIVLGVGVGYLVLDRKGDVQGDTAASGGTVEVKVVAEPGSEPPTAIAAVVTPETIAAPAESAAAITPPNLAAQPTAVAPATEPAPTIASAPAPTTAEAPAAVGTAPPASITAPAPNASAIARRPVFVDVRIDSKPSGATVMLVDRGKQTFLGSTPISTAVDPSRTYDVVFSHPRRKTQVEPLDPKATNRLAVELGKPGNRAKPEIAKPVSVAPVMAARVATTAKPVTAKGENVAKPVAVKSPIAVKAPVAPVAPSAKIAKPAKIVEPSWDTQIEKAAGKPEKAAAKVATTEPAKVETAPATKAEKAVGGNGVLMLSSKPPCEIQIDGKPTGLMTPQRALSLSAGTHKVTLVNPAQKIKKSFAVEITADEPTKVIQDLTALMAK